MDWTEKYRPKDLKGVIGNPSAVNALRGWAESWEKGIPEKRAVVLMGTPGVGKTTSAEALAREMGWDTRSVSRAVMLLPTVTAARRKFSSMRSTRMMPRMVGATGR